MPRHPPYARNKTHGHTNNQGTNTKTQKRKILASTIQFSHNTPTTPHQHTPCQQDSWSGTQKRGIMPQTPNNAPTYKQITFHCARHVCHKAPFKHLVMSYRVCVSPGQFVQPYGRQHDTRTLTQPRMQLHPNNTSSLERR